MKALPYVLAGCIGGLVSAANAQSLMINASAVGGLEHHHAPHLVTYDTQGFTAPTPTVSLHDYNTMRFTFNAPEGYAWLMPQSGYAGTGNGLRCDFAYGSKGTASTDRVWDYQFDFVPGMSTVVDDTGSFEAWVTDSGFGFAGKFIFCGDVEFTSLSVSVHGAPGIDVLALDGFSQATLKFEMTGDVPYTDLGARAFLVAVPEPGAGALMALAGVVWISKRSIV